MAKVSDILRTTNFVTVAPSDTLTQALSKLGSSHSVAFVFDDKKHYCGVVDPYHSLVHNNHPGSTLVEHAVFHAPHLHLNTPFIKIAALFAEAKIHYLPVFDAEDRFQGVIAGRDVLDVLQKERAFQVSIDEVLMGRKKPLITIQAEEGLDKALHLFKAHKIARLVVVNKEGRIAGIVSDYDVIPALIAPKDRPDLGDRQGNKEKYLGQKVKNFAKQMVMSMTRNHPLSEAMQEILKNERGSVVIVGDDNLPEGIITLSDFFRLFSQAPKLEPTVYEITDKTLSDKKQPVLQDFVSWLKEHVAHQLHMQKVHLVVREERAGELFSVSLTLTPMKGKPLHFQKEDMGFEDLLKDLRTWVRELSAK